MDEARLIERAVQRDREAFDELYSRHDKNVFGFIRARTARDADAQDVAQETRIEIWRKVSSYNPILGSFVTFAKFWASKKLLQHYDAEGRRQRVRVLFSELTTRFPDLEQEPEIEALVSRLRFQNPFALENEEETAAKEQNLVAVYEELLSLTFNGPSPPHQLIAFGLVKLLERRPREVVAEFSSLPLRVIEERLEIDYINNSQLPEGRVLPCFGQLRENLDWTFGEVVKEPRTRKTYPHLLPRVVGETILREYYTKQTEEGQADNIVKWWDAVSRRVWSEVQGLRQGALFNLLQAVEPE
jgi:RNA polymerase sigma factor (sigma-70 family)